MFLHIVESGIQNTNLGFAAGTFRFLLVCKYWNEVAVSFPRLWRWCVSGAIKAWPLFNARSKDTPLSLTWRPMPKTPAGDFSVDPGISKRIRQLNFVGNSQQLTCFLGAFDSNPPSNVSSMQLHIVPYDHREPQGPLARFLSSSFPKLSQLDLWNFLPDSSSPIFTTSCLTLLRLYLPNCKKSRYTLPQFSQILQQHPNLQKLDLSDGAIPLPGPPNTSVPFTLPRLVGLRLHGLEADISGFIDFIGLSSHLHDVTIRFSPDPGSSDLTLTETVKKILVGYYECRGLDHPRKVNDFTVSYSPERAHLMLDAKSRSTLTSNPRSNLNLQFDAIFELAGVAMVKETLPLFPLNDVRVFTAEGPPIYGRLHNLQIFRKMVHLSHLRLNKQDIFPALLALSPNSGSFKISRNTYRFTHAHTGEQDQQIFPKLESLTLSDLDILFGYDEKLLGVLKGRRDCNIGLKKLFIHSCRVHRVEWKSELKKLVKGVKWQNVEAVGVDYEDTDDDCLVGRRGCGGLVVRRGGVWSCA